jgi:small-conductance mechanosensitive channel
MMRRLLCLLLLCLGLALAAPQSLLAQQPAADAQENGTPSVDFDAWEAEAQRVENLIEAGTASTSFFENMRAQLVEWRSRFLDAETANASRVETIRAQLDALGPPPEEGASEPDAIAERREELNRRLAQAQEPQLNAAAAFTRADGLIDEIDALLRERQQQQLLELEPSPANPVNWPTAVVALRDVAFAIERQIVSRVTDPVRQDELVNNAPGIALLALVGLFAVARGRPLTMRLTERLQARTERRRGRISVAFLVSLLQVAVPLLGVILLLTALITSGMVGPQGRDLLEALGGMAVAIYSSLWLAGRLFRSDADTAFADLRSQPGRAAAARKVTVSIGIASGLAIVLLTIANFDQVPPAAEGVIQMPVYLVLGYLFWRAARLLRTDVPPPEAEESAGVTGRTVGITSTALTVLAIVGPLLAVIGYINATEAVMLPAALSLGIAGILLALQPVVRDLYAVILRKSQEDAAAALLPVLVNSLVIFAALPLFALIWGMRPELLGDIYSRFWEGIPLGDARLTPGAIFAVVVVFALGLVATRLLQGALKTTVLPRTRLDPGARTAITSGVGYVGIGLAAVIAITSGGIDLTALGVVVGALSVGIGFGLQNVVNNFVSGIILLIERPISEGDWIEVNGMMGIVKSISVRSTRIETFDKTDVIVPNADFISGTVTNWTRGNTVGRAVITVGVAYGTDTRRVQEILLGIAREHPVVAAYPEPGVDFLGFGADSLDFRIRAILRDVNQLLSVQTELNHRIAERFAEEGIEIPFAQRDIWLRNPETLRPASSAAGATDQTGDAAT